MYVKRLLPTTLTILFLSILNIGLYRTLSPKKTSTLPVTNIIFNQSTLNGWPQFRGAWSAADGVLSQSYSMDDHAILFAPVDTAQGEAFTLRIRVKALSPEGYAGLVFNAIYPQVKERYQFVIVQQTNGQLAAAAGFAADSGVMQIQQSIPITSTDAYLTIACSGDRYSAWVNQTPIIENASLLYTAGVAGFITTKPVAFSELDARTWDGDTGSLRLAAAPPSPATIPTVFPTPFPAAISAIDLLNLTAVAGDWQRDGDTWSQRKPSKDEFLLRGDLIADQFTLSATLSQVKPVADLFSTCHCILTIAGQALFGGQVVKLAGDIMPKAVLSKKVSSG